MSSSALLCRQLLRLGRTTSSLTRSKTPLSQPFSTAVSWNDGGAENQRELHQLPPPLLDDDRSFTKSETYKQAYEQTVSQVRLLNERLHSVRQGGGASAVQRHWERNKRLPRERIELLVDPGTPVLELSPLAGGDWKDATSAIGTKHHIPSGGIVTAIGVVSGKPCMMVANDATVKGGMSHADIANDDVEAVSCKQ